MPKAKPSLEGGVIVHRIELQKSERDMLEAAVMTNAVAKVGQAAGAIIAPFAGAFTAIIAAILAKSTVEDISGWAANQLGEKELVLADGYAQYLAAAAAARGAVHPPGHELEGQPLSPGPHRPDMTRAEYDAIYEKTAMTRWEVIQYRVAEATGGIYGSTEHHDTQRSRSEEKTEKTNCTLIGIAFGPVAAAACRATQMANKYR